MFVVNFAGRRRRRSIENYFKFQHQILSALNIYKQYLTLYNIESDTAKELILRFLYEMFTSNLEGYKLILHEKRNSLANENSNYTEKEKEIINNFLNWPDEG